MDRLVGIFDERSGPVGGSELIGFSVEVFDIGFGAVERVDDDGLGVGVAEGEGKRGVVDAGGVGEFDRGWRRRPWLGVVGSTGRGGLHEGPRIGMRWKFASAVRPGVPGAAAVWPSMKRLAVAAGPSMAAPMICHWFWTRPGVLVMLMLLGRRSRRPPLVISETVLPAFVVFAPRKPPNRPDVMPPVQRATVRMVKSEKSSMPLKSTVGRKSCCEAVRLKGSSGLPVSPQPERSMGLAVGLWSSIQSSKSPSSTAIVELFEAMISLMRISACDAQVNSARRIAILGSWWSFIFWSGREW